jgi:raffinose/stachyose/melibiose transport system substrate-binding protein
MMEGQMRRTLCAVIILGLVGFVSFATGRVETPSGPATLTLYHQWITPTDGNSIAMKQVLDGFAAANPDIKLDVKPQGSEDYNTKIRVVFSSNEAPDIAYFQGLGVMEPVVTAGKLLALDDYIAKSNVKDDLVGGTLTNYTFNGKAYGLPTHIAMGVLYCNKDLFDKAGARIPATFTELLEAIRLLNAKNITPMLFVQAGEWPCMFYYDILAIRTAGAQGCIDALTKKASWDQPAFVEAARRLQQLASAKAFKETDLALTWDEGVTKFLQGQVAMVFNGTWLAGQIQSENSPVKGKIIPSKFPVVEGGKGNIDEFFGGAFECFSINAATKNKDAAFKAITWICENFSKATLTVGNGLPAYKIPGLDKMTLDPFIAQHANLLKDSKAFCLWWDTFLGGKPAETHKLLVGKLLNFSLTPEDFAKEMQKLNAGQ